MKVKDFYTKNLVTIDVDRNLIDALKIMEKNRISRILVKQKDRIVGIVTMRDILKRLSSYFERKLPSSRIKVSSCYKKNLYTININSSLSEAAKKMLDLKISSLAVEDNGNIVGIITKTDLVKALISSDKIVKDYMTKKVVTVDPESTLLHAKELMLKNNVKRLVVVKNDRIVGIITEGDISIALYGFRKMIESEKMNKRMKFLKVIDFMSRDVITIKESDTIGNAAKIMLENNISGLPVVNNENKLVGIITKKDLLRCLM